MTRLFVDEREITFPHAGMSLDQLLKHVEATELAPNSVIHQVHVDGAPLVSDILQQIPTSVPMDIADRERIEIFTTSLEEVVRDSVREAISYLERVESVIPSVAASFQAYPGPEAFENLKQLYEGFYWLNLLLDRLERTLHFALADIQVRGTPVKQHHEGFLAILRQLVEAQERGDFILISDLLEYEVLPFIAVWKEIFGIFAADAPAPA